MNSRLAVEDYVAGIRAGDRAVLARAITLVESQLADDRRHTRELMAALGPEIAAAAAVTQRVGITGVPGVGKSTFIEALGLHLTAAGERVAVLAVDPSSARTGGSVLGDKTRMPELARDERAFIRPSPAAGSLGGIARNTREVMVLFEAAGYTVVLIETVGVGQSETMVAELVDFFLVLMLAGAGDELQGIKRGILELADMLVVNKADGENLARALGTRAELARVMHLMQPTSPHWSVVVEVCSALTGTGVPDVWSRVQEYRRAMTSSNEWAQKRRRQRVQWMWRLVEQGLLDAFHIHPAVRARLADAEAAVESGAGTPESVADELLACFIAGEHEPPIF